MSYQERFEFTKAVVGDWRAGRLSCEKAMVLIAELMESPDFQAMQKKRAIAINEAASNPHSNEP